MGALDSPQTWVPYMNTKECAKQICTINCPQWCYLIFPPPPPLAYPNDNSQNNTTFSPLVIAIIGSLASAFLLVTYYAIISKYCGRSSTRVGNNQTPNEETEENFNEFSQHEPWFISTHGLDEALIKNITLVKYKNGNGLIGSIECSVCLGEFQEDDDLRLLPKCSHAFHVACIDTWLRSHSNCPLCRANIVSIPAQTLHPPPILVVDDEAQNNVTNNEETSTSRDGSGNLPTRHFRTYSDKVGLALRERNDRGKDIIVMRRSISMDHLHETSVSISGMLKLIHGKDCEAENWHGDVQALKMAVGENSSMCGFGNCSTSSSNGRDGVHSVGLKRSFSSCRYLFSKHGRGSSVTIPL